MAWYRKEHGSEEQWTERCCSAVPAVELRQGVHKDCSSSKGLESSQYFVNCELNFWNLPRVL